MTRTGEVAAGHPAPARSAAPATVPAEPESGGNSALPFLLLSLHSVLTKCVSEALAR